MERIKSYPKAYSETGSHAAGELFWREYLNGEWLQTAFPANREITVLASKAYVSERFVVDATLAARILKTAKGASLNTYAILISGVFVLLRKYLRIDTLQIGTPLFDKKIVESRSKFLPIRADISGENSFREILTMQKNNLHLVLQHQAYPVQELRHEFADNTTNSPSSNNEYDILFVLDNLQDGDCAMEGDPGIVFEFNQQGESILLTIHNKTDVYNPNKTEILNKNLQWVLLQSLTEIDKPIKLISLTEPAATIEQKLAFSVPFPSIIEAFDEQVKKSPDQIALINGVKYLTYRELDIRSENLAIELSDLGVGPNCIVGILLERSNEMIIAILGILKAGGCYLPLDPMQPEERLDYILLDSDCGIVITNETHGQRTRALKFVLSTSKSSSSLSNRKLPRLTNVSDPLYIIYTSGTTGRPKGTVIENGNLLALLFPEKDLFRFGSEDTWVLFHTYCFDFSVWEIFGALVFGGKLVVMSDMEVREPDTLLRVLVQEKVTVLNQTPSAFYNLMGEMQKTLPDLSSLRYVIFGGESLRSGKLKKWRLNYPSLKFINMYGITETTVHVTFKNITDYEIQSNSSNIGVSLPHLSVMVVNQDGNQLPPGFIGEIIVGGASVSRGYLNQPELTHDRFMASSLAREYRSGDLAWVNEKGELIYVGRKDNQIQLKGYRIELGEVESWLLQYPGIENAIVTHQLDTVGDGYLCAYYVATIRIPVSDMRSQMSRQLPNYMVPARFVQLNCIPLNQNGKIDFRQLPTSNTIPEFTIDQQLSESQEAMLRIWCSNLGITSIPLDQSYFTIGGDSIKAIRLLNLINKDFNASLQLRDIYQADTVLKLVETLKCREVGALKASIDLVEKDIASLKQTVMDNQADPSNIEDVYPMADIQKGMVFYSGLKTDSPLYHDQMVHKLTYSGFDFAIFKQAVDLSCRRHGLLRAAFDITSYREPVIIIFKSIRLDIEQIDISEHSTHEQDRLIQQYLRDDRLQGFDFRKAPLWRIRVFLRNPDSITLLWICHHSIIDGWSDAAFKTELHNTYIGLRYGNYMPPAPLQCSYRDFVIGELVNKQSASVKSFWRKELEDYQPQTLVKKGDWQQEIKLASYRLAFGPSTFKSVETFCAKHQVSPRGIFFTAYLLAIRTLSYEDKFIVGITSHNRPVHEDGEKVLGCFLNVMPFNVRIDEGSSWVDIVKHTEHKLRTLKQFDQMPLMEIIRITATSSTDFNPFFDTLFNYIDFHVYDKLDTTPIDFLQVENSEGYTNTNTLLDFNVSNTQDTLELVINYDANSLKAVDAQRLGIYYQAALEGLICREDKVVKATLRRAERLNLVESLNWTGFQSISGRQNTIAYSEIVIEKTSIIKQSSIVSSGSIAQYLMAAYQILLYKYTQKKDLIVGYQSNINRSPDLQQALDLLLNVLPVQSNLDPTAGFARHCLNMSENFMHTYDLCELDRDELVSWLLDQKTVRDFEMIETIFTMYYNNPTCRANNFNEQFGKGYWGQFHDIQPSPVLWVNILEKEESLTFCLASYAIDNESVSCMVKHFGEIIAQITENKDILIDDIILSKMANKRIYNKGNIMQTFNFTP